MRRPNIIVVAIYCLTSAILLAQGQADKPFDSAQDKPQFRTGVELISSTCRCSMTSERRYAA
jgi:hypothetical protein